MKNVIYILFILLVSCDNLQPKKKSHSKLQGLPESVKLGETSGKDLNSELGEPTDTYEVKNGIVNIYEGGKALKLENDVAKTYFRNPTTDEVYLQYWLQLWKDQTVTKEKIESTKDQHGKYDYQLINKEAKTTIVYSDESGLVKRVMHYEN